MNAGRLDTRITLQEPTTSRDDFGQSTQTFAGVASVWAQRRDISAKETTESDQRVASTRTEWTIRWRSDVRETWRVVLKTGRTDTWEIVGILELGRREGLRLICERTDLSP
jgi:SPP1 family predicted phage head-tail adaptor